MTDEEYAEKQSRGQSALSLLEHPDFQAVYAAVLEDLKAEWAESSPSAPSLRDQKYGEVRGLLLLKTRLQAWVDDARFTAAAKDKRR